MHTKDPFDKAYTRVKYTRYADDFVVMIIGSKNLAENIREKIRDFLGEELQLELNMDKTVITNLSDRRVRFLGYEISKTREDAQLTKNTLGIKKRAANETIQLLVPSDVITEKLKPFMVRGKATHHNARINQPLLDTLQQYNSEIRGLYQYYCLATDVSKKIGRFRHYHYDSLLKTVARKEKSSLPKVIEKYGVEVKLKQQAGTRRIFGVTYQTKEGMKTMTYFNDSIKKKDKPLTGATANGALFNGVPNRHQIIERINAKKCELCEQELPNRDSYEVHHIRKLKDIKQEYARRGDSLPTWKLTMCSMNRKTLVVCIACHDAIHAGRNVQSIKKAVKAKTIELGMAGEPDTQKCVRPVRRGVQ
ncbi:hypothetical protein KDW_20810 [Dictyobacter vulcani]|uniref:Reverse transcriptase domain-containing protein n=1 Tax=Dictyobacter vulcani TaxID=2607529 RepID=A0A5J4KP86_9CHLR|nr:hypothetical protein KDW_20810 [Dictyobacter vulcani]